MPHTIYQLTPNDLPLMQALLTMFGEAFDDPETYNAKRPSDAYLQRLLAGELFIALAALQGSQVIGRIYSSGVRKF